MIRSSRAWTILQLLWLITCDDFATFVLPNTAFGTFGALSSSLLTTVPPSSSSSSSSSSTSTDDYRRLVLLRLPATILFNWSNLLIFDLANQRLPDSVAEDALNKPWRPIPRGLLTSTQMRRCMLLAIPLVLGVNHFWLHVGTETSLLFVLTWLYNDLQGGDESWVLRNVIIAAAFGVYNLGSLKVAGGVGVDGSAGTGTGTGTRTGTTKMTPLGVAWVVVISGVILATMQVQDLKDVAGDRSRGRLTAPLVLGDRLARWTIALPVLFWSVVCSLIWGPRLWGLPTVTLGILVAYRCVTPSSPSPSPSEGQGDNTKRLRDRRTWQLWAFWTATLYALPCM
ncbi:UbiA prenyltransferase [Apiospora saccharicola]|uniref:UbiA prenyltransferase n=1 Tax=Apiospora saccharicola TaxID=335842 RepID=A0ABR1U137_9PEZI